MALCMCISSKELFFPHFLPSSYYTSNLREQVASYAQKRTDDVGQVDYVRQIKWWEILKLRHKDVFTSGYLKIPVTNSFVFYIIRNQRQNWPRNRVLATIMNHVLNHLLRACFFIKKLVILLVLGIFYT